MSGEKVKWLSHEARIGFEVGAATVFVLLVLVFGTYTVVSIHNTTTHIAAIQRTNTANNKNQTATIKQLRNLVSNEDNSSTYLKTGVNDLRAILIYIGSSLTAICKATPECVLPKT